MTRLMWTCAFAVLPLVLGCDPDQSPDQSPHDPESAVAQQLPAPADDDDHDCECNEGCAEAEAHEQPSGAKKSPTKLLAAATVEAVRRTDRPSQGPKDARLELMVFSDFECSYCRKLVPTLEELLEAYPDDVRVTYKQLPLPFHESADPAARASLAAHRQGKFSAMHDALFEQPTRARDGELSELAAEIGLDVEQFERDMADPEIAARVADDADDARTLGIRGTPSMVIGNQLVVGAYPLEVLREIIDAELEGQ